MKCHKKLQIKRCEKSDDVQCFDRTKLETSMHCNFKRYAKEGQGHR